MYNAQEIQQQFVEQTRGTSDFKQYFEEAFASIEELERKQSIQIAKVANIGGRVKEWM